MAVRSFAAPPTPWSRNLAQPTIHESSYVHSFSNIIGDVRIGANVLVAPGTSIRADEGSPFYIGQGTNIQDGVVIHGLEEGRVKGDDGQEYSVWIGNNSSITHKVLIHGPAYIGEDCFIGFRSTVFNARIGKGCIIMMHVLIQDVEIPPGKYVPSGSIITMQQQADRLPDAEAADIKFSRHVVGINDALRSGYRCVDNIACIAPIRNELKDKAQAGLEVEVVTGATESMSYNGNGNGQAVGSHQVSQDVVQQVQHLLAGGYRIGTEHVDERRFRVNSWESCAPIQSTSPREVITALEACVAEHFGEYVRLIGIDTKSRQRVAEMIIHRPGAQAGNVSAPSGVAAYRGAAPAGVAVASGRLTAETVQQIRSLLAQGHRIGLESADARRYRTSSWDSGATIQSNREAEVVSLVEAFLAEHPGEYVRLIGVEPKGRRRVLELIVQYPNGKTPVQTGTPKLASASAPSHSTSATITSSRLAPEVQQQVQRLLSQGHKVGLEHADPRRYRASSWTSGATIQASSAAQAIATVESFLGEHPGEYVRIIGIDPKVKQRVVEMLIQKP